MNPSPQEVKRAMNKIVLYKPENAKYKFTAYIFRAPQGKPIYQAELQDLSAEKSVLICRFEDIELLEE